MNPKTKLLYGILVLIALLLPFQDFIYLVFAMKVLCFVIFACAFNLLLGFTGLLSFGHAAFFGTAAYITAYFCKVGRPFSWAWDCFRGVWFWCIGLFNWLISYSWARHLFCNGDFSAIANGLLLWRFNFRLLGVRTVSKVCHVECCLALLT